MNKEHVIQKLRDMIAIQERAAESGVHSFLTHDNPLLAGVSDPMFMGLLRSKWNARQLWRFASAAFDLKYDDATELWRQVLAVLDPDNPEFATWLVECQLARANADVAEIFAVSDELLTPGEMMSGEVLHRWRRGERNPLRRMENDRRQRW